MAESYRDVVCETESATVRVLWVYVGQKRGLDCVKQKVAANPAEQEVLLIRGQHFRVRRMKIEETQVLTSAIFLLEKY